MKQESTLCQEICGGNPNNCYYEKQVFFQHQNGGLTEEEVVIFDAKMDHGDPLGMNCEARGYGTPHS